MSSPRIKALGLKSFQTVHRNFTYPIDDLFDVNNGDNPDMVAGYNETTLLIQQFLQTALGQKKTVRVLGGNWSWTTVGFTKGWMLSTLKLNRIKRMKAAEIHPSAGIFEQDRFLFAQCGCSVIELNQVCQSLRRSLKTSGASNGQSIAGLISNNTHGSAIDFGSTPDFVVGLHIIVAPNKHVYLERASRPVVTQAFIQRIGAEHVLDDAIFNAAVVSFGSFGFIHGVMIETEPLFLYNVYRKQYPWAQIKPLMESLDFSQVDFLPRPRVRPYHFNAVINPYDTSTGPYITVMYKDDHRENYPRMVIPVDRAGPGEDAPMILGKLTDAIPLLTPLIVNKTLKASYKDLDNAWGTHGEVFNASLIRGKVLSCAIGLPAEHTNRIMDLALQLNEQFSFIGVFTCRYVKGTKATLGFTHYEQNCVAEFDSFEAQSTWNFYQALWAALEAEGIPYTFHWGKVNNLNAQRIRKMYGPKIDEWILARCRLIPKEMLPVFTNSFMEETGLDAIVSIA